MIAIDTNILVYAHRRDSPFFESASEVIREISEGSGAWAIPWPCIHEFLSVCTHPRIFRVPTPVERAIQQIEIWKESPGLRLLAESGAYWSGLADILLAGRIEGPAVHDARIAAICRSHGVRRLWSADRDFSRMAGIQVENPLVQRRPE